MLRCSKFNYFNAAFSLIEILSTLAIISILIGFSLPKFFAMQENARLSQAADNVIDQIRLARIEAATLNRPAAVVWIDQKNVDSNTHKRFIQIQRFIQSPYRKTQDDFSFIPMSKKITLPQAILIHPEAEWSSLLQKRTSDVDYIEGIKGDYRMIIIYPSGRTSYDLYDSEGNPSEVFLTLVSEDELLLTKPKKIITITIDPLTSVARQWRK